MTTCGHCGETLCRALGQWLHERESDTLAGLLFCPDGHKAEPTCPRCGHPNLDHYRDFCHYQTGPVAMCGCRVSPTETGD